MPDLNDLLGSDLFDFVRKHLSIIIFLIAFVVVPLIRNLLKNSQNKTTEERNTPPEPEWEQPVETVRTEKPAAAQEKPRPAFFEHKSREDIDPEEAIIRHRKGQTSQEKIAFALSSRNTPRHAPREGSEAQKTSAKTSHAIPLNNESHPITTSRLKNALSGKDMREVMIAGEIIQPRYF